METWNQCKAKVNNLPADFNSVIGKISTDHPDRIHRYKQTNGEVVTVTGNGILGYEVDLEVHFHKDKGVTLARYYAFNEKTSTCFVRDLLDADQEFNNL